MRMGGGVKGKVGGDGGLVCLIGYRWGLMGSVGGYIFAKADKLLGWGFRAGLSDVARHFWRIRGFSQNRLKAL